MYWKFTYLLLPALLTADTVKLHDGSSLTGDFVESTTQAIQIRTGGTLRTVPIREIDSISFQSADAPMPTATSTRPSVPGITLFSQDAEDYTVRLERCAKNGTAAVMCNFSAVNHRADRQLSMQSSYMVDSDGLQQNPQKQRLGTSAGVSAAVYNTPIPGEVQFGGVTPNVDRIAKLSLRFSSSGPSGNVAFEVVYRNVPLQAPGTAPPVLAGSQSPPAAVPAASFFPKRPKNAILHASTGVILDYGMGNKSGSFSIKEDVTGKTISFYLGDGIALNGRTPACPFPPTDTFTPGPGTCSYWPPDIRLGHTRVKVIWWDAKYQGEAVKVSDQANTVSQEKP
jgi:hypothetical protein